MSAVTLHCVLQFFQSEKLDAQIEFAKFIS